jgi:hypothetical protein
VEDGVLAECSRYAAEMGLHISPTVFDHPFEEAFGRMVMERLLARDAPAVVQLPPDAGPGTLGAIASLTRYADATRNRILQTQRLFEQRDKALYGTRRDRPWVMYYNDMGDHLSKRLGMWVWSAAPPRPRWTRPSQAWIKCYELLSLHRLLDRGAKRIRTFHLCEMPGNFIHACGTWARGRIPGLLSHEWHATSLAQCAGCPPGAFGDDYGFMRANPDNWSFGADGTGDVTVAANIERARE